MKFIPKLWAESADQKHVNNRSRLVSAPGANYYNGCQISNVWRRNMSRSRENKPRGSRKQQAKIAFAARARTLNRFKKLSSGKGIRSLSSFSLEQTHRIYCLVPRCLSFDENVRAKEGGKVCTLPMVPCGSSPVTRVSRSPLPCDKRSAWGGGCRIY